LLTKIPHMKKIFSVLFCALLFAACLQTEQPQVQMESVWKDTKTGKPVEVQFTHNKILIAGVPYTGKWVGANAFNSDKGVIEITETIISVRDTVWGKYALVLELK